MVSLPYDGPKAVVSMWLTLLAVLALVLGVLANPDAKRLYDDLLSNYNRLIRPVSNNTDTVLVKLGLRLSQLIDLVSQIIRIEVFPNIRVCLQLFNIGQCIYR